MVSRETSTPASQKALAISQVYFSSPPFLWSWLFIKVMLPDIRAVRVFKRGGDLRLFLSAAQEVRLGYIDEILF